MPLPAYNAIHPTTTYPTDKILLEDDNDDIINLYRYNNPQLHPDPLRSHTICTPPLPPSPNSNEHLRPDSNVLIPSFNQSLRTPRASLDSTHSRSTSTYSRNTSSSRVDKHRTRHPALSPVLPAQVHHRLASSISASQRFRDSVGYYYAGVGAGVVECVSAGVSSSPLRSRWRAEEACEGEAVAVGELSGRSKSGRGCVGSWGFFRR